MTFFIFNIAFFVILITVSFTIKTNNVNEQTASKLVNIILLLAALFALMALTMGLSFWAAPQFALVIAKITFTLIGWFAVSCCDYVLVFPDHKKGAVMYIAQWMLNILAVYLIFRSHGIDSIEITETTFNISSGALFSFIDPHNAFFHSFAVYTALYFVIIPLFTMLMLLVRAENEEKLIARQRTVKNIFGIVSSWILMLYIFFGGFYQSMLMSLMLTAYIPEMLIFINSSTSEEIIDAKTFGRMAARFGIRYVLPGITCAYVYSILWPKLYDNAFLFEVIYVGLAIASTMMIFSIRRISSKTSVLRDVHYAEAMTQEIKAITLEGSTPVKINTELFNVFKKYNDISSFNVLGDLGDGTLSTIYSTNDTKFSISIEDHNLEVLLGTKRHVFLRQYIQHEYSISDVRENLLHIMDENNSDAFIILNEGRHIIGIIMLGKKASGNHFTDYDYETLNGLYSDFFVLGYYEKNIANEDVVGTVNREIQMSGQIITSIQENMDFIKNPKIDAGYLMVPAHNIGGEFIDFIRLNDFHHLFIIGALSGKGIAASMNMVILKSVIRTFLSETTDFKELIQKINYFICTGLPKGTYFAGTIGLLDFVTNTMFYVNCGSAGIFYYTKSFNNVIEVQGEGHILGFKKDISSLIKVRDMRLSSGDIILSCTDGLLESRSLRGEAYGKERIQKQIVENVPFDASKTAKFIYNNLKNFTSKELEDDITILVFKYLGENK